MSHSITYSPATPIIITGGASGIGQASARALAEVGRPVALWDLDPDKTASVAQDIEDKYGVKTIGIAVDVADLEQIDNAVSASRKTLGPIGGLVHAAGVSGVSTLEQLTVETWTTVMDINLRAEIFIVQAILPDLKVNQGSAIVGIASINATLGNLANPTYSASKGGMLSLNRALADDLANHNIRINSISPGQIATPMLEQAFAYDADLEETFKRKILLQRLGQPEEVAKAVRFLLSDEASYITATELIVDGGNVSSQR